MTQGLASRVEKSLPARIAELVSEVPGGTIIVFATVALYPLIRFGELLRDMRDLGCRVVLAFPARSVAASCISCTNRTAGTISP